MALQSVISLESHAARHGDEAKAPENAIPVARVKQIAAALILGFSAILIFLAIDDLTMPMRLTLAVFVTTIVAWTVLDLPETTVALWGAVALALTGAVNEDMLYRSLGNDIVWLMLAAFIIAAVLKQTGIVEHIINRFISRVSTVNGIFWSQTLLIFATAFIIPSTSARAALLMPIYVGLSSLVGTSSIRLALALLFPSVILLSAGASIIGAGAHLVALDFMSRTSGDSPGFLGWIALAAPFSLLCCLIVCFTLLYAFMTKEERAMRLAPELKKTEKTAFSYRQLAVLAIIGITILLFSTQGLHGIGMPLIAIMAALVLTSKSLSGLSLKAALKSVEWNLLLFLAATLVIGEALVETGTAQMIAERIVALFGTGPGHWPGLIIAFAIVVATLSHLVITSRTARAAVLIPALALPLSGLGVNPVNLVLAVTLASGFCQTLMVSAKPVTLFGSLEPPAFRQSDLFRLTGFIALPFILLLIGFATLVWPMQGVALR